MPICISIRIRPPAWGDGCANGHPSLDIFHLTERCRTRAWPLQPWRSRPGPIVGAMAVTNDSAPVAVRTVMYVAPWSDCRRDGRDRRGEPACDGTLNSRAGSSEHGLAISRTDRRAGSPACNGTPPMTTTGARCITRASRPEGPYIDAMIVCLDACGRPRLARERQVRPYDRVGRTDDRASVPVCGTGATPSMVIE